MGEGGNAESTGTTMSMLLPWTHWSESTVDITSQESSSTKYSEATRCYGCASNALTITVPSIRRGSETKKRSDASL